jgi:Ser/Thr protein kinase RdoA (MazF antagonist)
MPSVEQNFVPLLTHFSIPGKFVDARCFGSGLINDTYLCEFLDAGQTRKYILQRINSAVFKQPEFVMENVQTVTAHIANKLRSRGVSDPGSIAPVLVPSRDSRSFVRDDSGEFWRVYHFIESGSVHDVVSDSSIAREAGRALGRFQSLVSDLDADTLHDTLPGFHVTPRYLDEFDEAVHACIRERTREVQEEIAFVGQRRPLARTLTDALHTGSIPLRVVHNDPKVNNVMFDAATGRALCMLDLDTVKPGIVHFDFGDCVRSATNPQGEDAVDPATVRMDFTLFEALAAGYLEEARGFLTAAEIELLAISACVITFELGLRFLTDHLRGDPYFRVAYPGQNLHRARVQFRLLASMEEQSERMQQTVESFMKPQGFFTAEAAEKFKFVNRDKPR